MRCKIQHLLASLLLAHVHNTAHAVPTSFLLTESGNQHDATWNTVESKKFRVYHESFARNLGEHALNSVEYAWPYLSYIFNERMENEDPSDRLYLRENSQTVLFSPIAVILNTRAEVGGFANFATQNIEVQTQSGAPASLFQHELVHHIMYERMDPKIGPAGRTFTIGLMPTWWIEGVAEYLTESVGRTESDGIARTISLKNKWPTWDSLHNLYNSSGDFGKGYVTSGRFFGFLRNKARNLTISELHDKLFWRSFIPPFVTATKITTSSVWNSSGPNLYSEFQQQQLQYWTKELAGMPSLLASNLSKIVTQSRSAPQTVVLDNDTALLGSLNPKPFESALILLNPETNKKTRLPLNVEGSGIFAMNSRERMNGGFWTTTEHLFDNATRGNSVHYVTFRNDVANIQNGNLKQRFTFPLSTAKRPVVVQQILALGSHKAFAIGSVKGNYTLYYLEGGVQKRFIETKQWNAPSRVKLIPSVTGEYEVGNTQCVNAIVETEQEIASVERICENGEQKNIVAPQQFSVLNALDLTNDELLLHVAWGTASGMIRLKRGVATSQFTLPEWIVDLVPWSNSKQTFATWAYNGNDFELIKFTPDEVHGNWERWIANQPKDSQWRDIPKWTRYTPPFVRIANEERELLRSQTNERGTVDKETPTNREQEKLTYTRTKAPFKGRPFYTYPNILPPYMGGWAVGLTGIPYIDEMERHRVELSGQYYLPTKTPSVELRYVSNRLFDGFAISTFIADKYNGIFYNQYCKNESANRYSVCGSSQYPVKGKLNYGYDDYLREQGVAVATHHRFLPTSMNLSLIARASKITPYTELIRNSEVQALGIQRATLASLGAIFNSNLHETAFYMGPANEAGRRHLTWRTGYTLSAETQHGIGKSQDFVGNNLDRANFQKYRISTSSSLAYKNHALSARGEMGGTIGSSPLNLREVFQPYRTYLLGTSSSINGVNVPILGDNGVFARSTGAYSFRTDLTYSFPIFDDIDYEFLILYFESMRGEVVVGRGGVAHGENFEHIFTRDSASAALRATINIKGFQIFPSVAYGQLIGKKGWSLFSEVSFSQFF